MREFACLIAVLPFITWLLTHKKHKDIMAPYNLATFLYIVNIMLPTMSYANLGVAKEISVPYIRSAVSNNSIYFTYVVLQTMCYYLMILGTRFRVILPQNSSRERAAAPITKESQNRFRILGFILWLIGAFAFFQIMNHVGGVYYFFTHLQYRASLTRSLGFWTWILPFVNYGILFIVYSYKGSDRKLSPWVIAMAVASGIMSGLGGRKALLILLIEVVLLYHYCVKEIDIKRFFRPKYILAIVLIYIFFILMTKFRTSGAFESFLQNPIEFISQSNDGILATIRNESYVTFYMAIIEYFKTHAFWMGRTFLGLVVAIIPSSLFPQKPPVDDGTYLYSICQGRTDIVPPMPFSELNGSSYPLETFGSMYGNFGIIGLVLGMLLLGAIYGYAYRKIKSNSYSLFSVVVYTQVIFTFHFSTLRIFQLFEMIVVLGIITFIGEKGIKIKR